MRELLEAAGPRLALRPVRAAGVLSVDDSDATELLGVSVRIKILILGEQLALSIVLLVGRAAGSHAARLFRLSVLVEDGRLHPGIALRRPAGHGGIASPEEGLFGLWFLRRAAVARDRNGFEQVEVLFFVWTLLFIQVYRDNARLPLPHGSLVGTGRVPSTLLGPSLVTSLAHSRPLVVELL